MKGGIIPDELLNFDDPAWYESEQNPTEGDKSREPDPHLRQMIGDALPFLTEAERGPVEMVPVERDYASESGLQNLADALADKLKGHLLKPDEEKEQPTIWYHGGMSYAAYGGKPKVVSNDLHNLLKSFLDRDGALDTRALALPTRGTLECQKRKDVHNQQGYDDTLLPQSNHRCHHQTHIFPVEHGMDR